jgi:putative FmdB family regulatory protein
MAVIVTFSGIMIFRYRGVPMPIYEYRCTECGYKNEYLQRMSDAPLTDCPECGKSTFSKLISAAGFQLKGGGWYATDFKNNGAKPKKDTPAKEGDKSSDSGKSNDSSGKNNDSKSEASSGAGACAASS